jgi:hypothetical protein
MLRGFFVLSLMLKRLDEWLNRVGASIEEKDQ